ncbi:MAG: Tol-Pal system beta propeller repeat protein TolB [Candidatus Zixiibacteriota bacterium]
MSRVVSLLVFSLTILLAASAAGQGTEIPNILFDTITGVYEPTQIGVDDTKYIGDRYITAQDSLLMQYVTWVIQNDLDFYADFELVPIDTFYLRVYEIAELDLLGWKRLGVRYLVKLDAEFPGSNMRIRWHLYDTTTMKQFAKGNVEEHRSQWRELAHDVSNEIVRTLTGDPGIFRTRVVFVRQNDNAKELFIADYDGSGERQLTNTGAINLSPMFSPDGGTIYFTSYLEGDPKLFKVSVASGEMTKVADYPGIVAAPSLSPDGNKIACVLTKDGNSEIYVLDLSGRIIKRLTYHWAIDTSPTWSPDGRLLAFSSDRSGFPQIYIMDADGLNVRRLTYEGGYNDSPVWSARSDRITFVSRSKAGRFDIASIDTSGNDYRILTDRGMNENPHFAPDGKHIVFSSSRPGRREIYTMDITGRSQRCLTNTGGCSNPVWGPLK